VQLALAAGIQDRRATPVQQALPVLLDQQD
jgi:hypothetical protein